MKFKVCPHDKNQCFNEFCSNSDTCMLCTCRDDQKQRLLCPVCDKDAAPNVGEYKRIDAVKFLTDAGLLIAGCTQLIIERDGNKWDMVQLMENYALTK